MDDSNTIGLVKSVSIIFEDHYRFIQNCEISGYIKHFNKKYYVAIPFNNEKDYYDKFVGFVVEKNDILLKNGTYVKGLFLSADDSIELDQFTYVAVDFLKVANREMIEANPYDWTDKWRGIFGDAIEKSSLATTLGELLALLFVYKSDKSAVWTGPKAGSQDITCKDYDVEVKTTSVDKKVTRISINSALQLGGAKKQMLYYVRLEPKPYLWTINKAVDELGKIGFPTADIEDVLLKKGFPKGSRVREESYDLLEIRSFDVNANIFPLISLEKLRELTGCRNIIDYSLSIDLSSAPYESIYSKK